MAQIVVTASDLEQIEALIEDHLASFHPTLNVSRGTPLNDILVQGFKVPIALVTSLAESYRQTRSIKGAQRLLDSLEAGDATDPDIIAAKYDVESAVVELLSNWFITKLGGRKSKGLINIHLSSNIGFNIPTDWRAYRTTALPYLPLTTSTTVVNAADLVPIVNSDGTVLEYIYRLMVEAEYEGDVGDVNPGEWEAFDRLSPFMTKVTSDFLFTNGADDESTQEQLDRAASTGISERTLDNQRALTTFFSDNFPEYLPITSIRAGDAEMQRDLLALGGTFRIHQLGHWNIYTAGNILESQTFTSSLRSQYVHPVTNALELGIPHRMLLPQTPVLFIREIRWKDTGLDPLLTTFADADGYIRFDLLSRYSLDVNGNRIETPYTDVNQAKLLPIDDERAYLYWNSYRQGMFLEINPSTFAVDGQEIEIVYDTIANFSTIHTLIEDSENRPGAGDPLVYSYVPVVLSFTIEYVRRTDVADTLTIDVADAKQQLTSFIRGQTHGTPLFASAIMQEFISLYGDIAAGVKPLTLNYYAWLPDGSKVLFESNDRVSLAASYYKSGEYTPKDEYGNAITLEQLQYSDRTMSVYADEVNIEVLLAT